MPDMNNEWKVQLGAELKDSAKSEIKTKIRSWNDFVVYIQKVILTSDAKEKIKEQLNGLKGLTPTINSIKISSDAKDGIKNTLVNLKNLNVNVDKVSLANDIGSKIQKQLDALKLNINVNGIKVNPSGVGQNSSAPPSKKQSGGIYKTSDLNQKNLAYMTKAYNTIEKQLREIQKLANQQNWQNFDVTGIEQANGLIKSFKINVVDATGAIKQLNFEREKIQTDKGKVYTGFVQEDEVKIIQTATKATEKFSKVQNKAVSDFNNTIKQITSAANDKNATKPITSTESLNRLNTQIKNVDDAMDVLRNSTSDTFDTAKIKVKEEISVLKSLIKELRNADNVSNKLKGTDFTSGKSIAKFNLDKLKVQAKDFPKMEATLKALDDTFDNISDVGSLNNFNDQLTVAQAELSKVKEEAKGFEKAYADAYKELKKLYDLKIEFAKLDNPSQYDEAYYNSAINAQEATYRQAKSKTTTPENWNVQQQNALTHKEYEYQKDLQDAYNKTAYSASELKKVLDNLNNGTYSSQYEVLKNKALSYVDANGQAILSVDKLINAYTAFTSAKTDTEKVQAARNFTEAYKQLDSQLKTTVTSLDKVVTTQQRLAKANTIESWMQKNTKITGEARAKLEAYVKTLRNTDTAMNKMQFNNITNGFRNIENNMRSIGKLGYSFIDQMEQAAESFTQWISISAAIMGVVNKTRQAVNELKEVNTLLTEISKANDQLTKDQLANIGNRSFDVASKYGKSATDYLSGVQEASRAGYTNAEEIAELSTAAQGAGDMTAELANQMLIATDKAYKLGGSATELTKILDGVNYITNHNAVNMSELSEGLSIVGSTAASFGVEANELTAALGTMAATTQQSGSEVARAFRAILLNIRQVSDEEEGIDAEGLTKYENACNALGVSLKETKNGILELRDPMEVLEELAEEYNKLSETDLRRTELLNSVGGKLRSTQLDALLRQFDTYKSMLQQYEDGAGSMAVEAEKTANSWEGSLNRLHNTFVDTVDNMANSDGIIYIINMLNDALSVVNNLTDAMGSMPSLASILGAGMSLKGMGVVNYDFRQDEFSSLFTKQFVQINEEAEKTFKSIDKIPDLGSLPDDYWDTFIQKNEIADDILADFLTTAKNTDKNLEGYKQHLKNLSLSTSLFSQATTTATRMVKGLFATFTNMVILAAVVAGIQLLAKAIDNLNHTYDELKEEVQSSTEEFKNLKSELSTLESQLKTNEDRIKELNSLPHLKLIEQEELDRLKESNDELREQIYLKGLDVEKANRESQDDAIKFLSKEENYSAVSGFDNYGIATFEQNEGNAVDRVKWQIDEYERLIQLEKDLVAEKSKLEAEGADTEIIESELNIIDSQLKALEGRIPTLIKDVASMKASFVEGSTESATWLPQIEDLEDYYFDVFNVTFDNKDVQDKFDEVWNAVDFKKYRTELEEMARAGTLDASDLDGNENFQRLLEATGESAENLTEHIYATTEATDALNDALSKADPNNATQSDALTKLDSLKSGFKSLAEIYNSISVDKKLNMDLLDEDFVNTFSVAKEEFNDFIDTITNSPSDISACQGAFDNLVSAWLNSEDILSVLNDDTVKLIGTFLEEQGVVDATSWMMAELEARKLMAVGATDALTNATVSEINVFFDELDASEETKEALARLELTKRLVNATTIDTSGDIANLIALAEQAGATARELSRAKSYEKVLNNLGKYGGSVSAEELEAEKAAAMKEFEYVSSFKPTTGSGSVKNNGGGYTPKSTSTSSSGGSSGSSSTKEFKETFDFFERRIEVLTDSFENLGATMDNVLSAKAKNTLLSSQAGILAEEIKNYTSALSMYSAEAEKSLAGLDASIIDKIKNGAIELTDFVGENGEAVVNAMEAYKGWADKVQECEIRLAELRKEIAQIELTKFNNIAVEHSNRFDLYGNSIDLIDKQIGLFEEAGELVGESFYEEQIHLSDRQLDALQAKKSDLARQMAEAIASGNIEKGKEEWMEMVNTLNDVDAEILETKTSIEQLENAFLQLDWDTFDRIQTRFDNLNDELQNLVGLFDDANENAVLDDNGVWTDEAVATLGLYAQQYETAKYRVEEYSDAIDKLQREYNNGKYSATEYADKLAELTKGQWDAVNSAEAMEDAIISLNKTRVDEEIEAINKLTEAYREETDARIEALNAEKDLHDYKMSIQEKTKNIANIEKQIAALANNDSLSAKARRAKLEEQLAEARADLEEAEYQHSVDSRIEALEKNYETYEEKNNAEIEALQESLKDRETIISNSFETVKNNADLIGQEIEDIANQHGVKVSDMLISSWQSGENAIASYGTLLNTKSSEFIAELANVEQKEWDLQEQANLTSESLASMFSHKAEGLVSEFDSATSSIYDMNKALEAVQRNLYKVLESGLDTSALEESLEEAKSATKSSSGGSGSSGGFSSGSSSSSKSTTTSKKTASTTYDIIDGKGNVLVSGIKDEKTAVNRATALRGELGNPEVKVRSKSSNGKTEIIYLGKYAKGGIVGKDDKDSLFDMYAKRIGEDRMIAVQDGEGILSKEQTKAFLELAPMLDELKPSFVRKDFLPQNVPSTQKSVSYNYDSILTVNGNIDDTNAEKITSMIRKELRSTFSKIDRDHRYSGY